MDTAQAYMDLLVRWSHVAEKSGLAHIQIAVCAAEFAGIVIANAGMSLDGQAKTLETCSRAMSTKCAANNVNKGRSR